MEKGSCELCSKPARMYCDSDQARLCWDCDEKVHSANFLVAKHSRSLLCHVCQSPTPWKASGTKLGPTISVCESCFDSSNAENPATRMRMSRHQEGGGGETDSLGAHSSNESETDGEYDDDDDDDDGIEEEEEEEEDGENQVVPWSSCPPTPSSSAPPLTTSSSSEHESISTRDGGAAVSSALKRSRDNQHLDSDDEENGCCSSLANSNNTGAMENRRRASFRALKMARAEELIRGLPENETELRSRRRRMELLGSLMSFQQTMAGGGGGGGGGGEHNASEVIRRISKLSRDAF